VWIILKDIHVYIVLQFVFQEKLTYLKILTRITRIDVSNMKIISTDVQREHISIKTCNKVIDTL